MQSKALDKVKEAYEILVQWEADEAAGVAGTTDKPEAKSASEPLFAARMLLQEALRMSQRQCDVGTEKEQADRHKAYCRKHYTPDALGGNCRKCPLKDLRGWSCQLAWAQTPYEAQEGAGE